MLSIVGYEKTALTGLHHVVLTTVDQPQEEMGRVAFTAMLARLSLVHDDQDDGGDITAQHHIMPRD